MRESLSINAIEDLTSERLTNILRQNWTDLPTNFKGITHLNWRRLDQGILSRVYHVIVTYHMSDDESMDHSVTSLPNMWLVKLPREDLPLQEMFHTEMIMYETFKVALPNLDLPFTVPRILLGSNQCLMIEGIPDIVCYELIWGTPMDKISFVTKILASLHAATWKSEFFAVRTKNIQRPPGIGHALLPLQRQFLFQQNWRIAVETTVQNGGIQREVQDFIVNICHELSFRRLQDVHEIVHSQELCCIHGDFNISNLLFPKELDDGRKPVLIDWATAGYSNPLIDVAFFLILNDCAAADSMTWLRQYHHELIQWKSNQMDEFSFNEMVHIFRWAILYQWIILVAYDGMSAQLAEGNQKLVEAKLKHFNNVKRRAMETLYSIGDFEIDKVTLLTEKDRKEALDFSRSTPLST